MSTDAPLIEAPRKNRLPLIIGGVLVLALVAGLIYAFVGKDDDKGTTTVTIGVIGGSDLLGAVQEGRRGRGHHVETVNFTDYTQPNPALSQGRDSTSTSSSTSCSSPTTTWPPSDDLHADRLHRGLPAGAVLHASTTPSRRSRRAARSRSRTTRPTRPAACWCCRRPGLISLKNGGSDLLRPRGRSTSRVEGQGDPVDAAQTAAVAARRRRRRSSTTTSPMDAGLDPTTRSPRTTRQRRRRAPYINIFAARAEDKDDPTYQKLVELFQHPEVSGRRARGRVRRHRRPVKTPVRSSEPRWPVEDRHSAGRPSGRPSRSRCRGAAGRTA